MHVTVSLRDDMVTFVGPSFSPWLSHTSTVVAVVDSRSELTKKTTQAAVSVVENSIVSQFYPVLLFKIWHPSFQRPR